MSSTCMRSQVSRQSIGGRRGRKLMGEVHSLGVVSVCGIVCSLTCARCRSSRVYGGKGRS